MTLTLTLLILIYIIGVFATSVLLGYLDVDKNLWDIFLWPISVPIVMVMFCFDFLMEKGYNLGKKWRR